MDGFAVGQFGDARLEKGALFVQRMVERSTVRLRQLAVIGPRRSSSGAFCAMIG